MLEPKDVTQAFPRTLNRDGGRLVIWMQLVAANLDWNREDTGLGTFDVVLACDVLYERPAVEPVAALVPKLLDASSTSAFILADPEARTRDHRLPGLS